MAHAHDHHDHAHETQSHRAAAHDDNHEGHDHAGHSHHHGSGHHHGHSHGHGSTDKTRVLIAAGLTGGFMVAEAIGGLVTGSLALLADAGHMLTDSIALLLAWYAFHLGSRAPTGRLTYGFDRVKTLVAYTNGLTVFAIGLFILYEAVRRVFEPVQVMGAPMLGIAVLGLLVNIAAFFVLHGGDRNSLNMRGAVLHVLGDLLGSVAAIVAALVIIATGWWPIDPILSVLVSVLLFRSALALMRESGHVLLEGVPDTVDRDTVIRDLEASIAGLREVHHVHVWSMDGSRNIATLHACLKEDAEPSSVVRAVKQRLAERHNIAHATVETERDTCADAAAHAH
jgi:cobalt-zinc-cadmium efflux system protein